MTNSVVVMSIDENADLKQEFIAQVARMRNVDAWDIVIGGAHLKLTLQVSFMGRDFELSIQRNDHLFRVTELTEDEELVLVEGFASNFSEAVALQLSAINLLLADSRAIPFAWRRPAPTPRIGCNVYIYD